MLSVTEKHFILWCIYYYIVCPQLISLLLMCKEKCVAEPNLCGSRLINCGHILAIFYGPAILSFFVTPSIKQMLPDITFQTLSFCIAKLN